MAAAGEDVEVLRARFLKAYASIPFKLRGEIVALVGDETFSWAAAYIEVFGKTPKGNEILKHMHQIGLLVD